MGEILSQSEIDALINAMVNEEAVGATPPAAPKPRRFEAPPKRIRPYDFRRPDKFSKEQLRTLQFIHENFARLLNTFFAANFRTVVQMVVGAVDQNTYADFMRGIQNPSVITPFTLDPLPGTCVLDISPVVAFPMLDRMFGGPGHALQQLRPLTDIEASVMSRVIKGTLDALRDTWSNLMELHPRQGPIDTNPMFVQVVAPTEIVVTIAIDVRIGEHVGVITLCLPYTTLEPILEKLTAHNWYASSRREPSELDLSNLQERVGEAKVTLATQLGAAQLTIREILDLGPGDVVVLDRGPGDPALVLVGNQVKYQGRVGRLRGRMAVEIIGLAPKGEEEHGE